MAQQLGSAEILGVPRQSSRFIRLPHWAFVLREVTMLHPLVLLVSQPTTWSTNFGRKEPSLKNWCTFCEAPTSPIHRSLSKCINLISTNTFCVHNNNIIWRKKNFCDHSADSKNLSNNTNYRKTSLPEVKRKHRKWHQLQLMLVVIYSKLYMWKNKTVHLYLPQKE